MGVITEGNFISIVNSSNSLEKNQKEEEYIVYIEQHKERVKLAYNKFFVPLIGQELDLKSCSNEEFQEALTTCNSNISLHDMSKYSDIEFQPYRLKWYPTVDESLALEDKTIFDQMREEYEAACKHHIKNNPHHPQYWVDEDGNIRDMELKYIIEMMCDWLSFGKDIRSWYSFAEDEKATMSAKTKEIVEELMELIYTKQ
jgi:hypothetical protein